MSTPIESRIYLVPNGAAMLRFSLSTTVSVDQLHQTVAAANEAKRLFDMKTPEEQRQHLTSLVIPLLE